MIYALIAIVSFALGLIASVYYMNTQVDPKYKGRTLFLRIAQDMLDDKRELKELKNTLIAIDEYISNFEDLQNRFDMDYTRIAPETTPISSDDHSLRFLFNEIQRRIPIIEEMRLRKKRIVEEIEKIRTNIENCQNHLNILRNFMS